MTLIVCPECKKQISDLASECPSCGYPIGGGGTTQSAGGRVQTVEQTGKKWKLQQLVAGLVLFTGIVLLIVLMSKDPRERSAGLTLGSFFSILIGLIWYIFARFFAWWHHG